MNVAPTDLALFCVSIVTCSYCFVLNRRLQSLRDSKTGLASTIESLSGTIGSLHASTERTRNEAKQLAEMLSTEIKRARDVTGTLSAETQKAETRQAALLSDLDGSYQHLAASLWGVVDESRTSIAELSELLAELRALRQHADTDDGRPAEDTQRGQADPALEELF